MANNGVQIDTSDVRRVSRALKGVSKEAQKELKDELYSITTFLVTRIKTKMPNRSGRARASLKPRKVQAGMRVAFGGNRAPHAPWLEFGGSTKVLGRGNRVQREFIKEGRYIWPTIGDEKDTIKRDVDSAMQKLARKHGLDLTGGGR